MQGSGETDGFFCKEMNGLWKVAVCMVAVLFSTGIAHGRDLRWRDVRVEAQLTRQGILHVQEYLTLVFTGNWNGAERRFRFRTGERIHVKGIYRIRADDGRKIPLARGDLDLPGHWNWWNWGRTVLRWRIRKPGDPVFHGTRLTFLLDYTIDGALVKPVSRAICCNAGLSSRGVTAPSIIFP